MPSGRPNKKSCKTVCEYCKRLGSWQEANLCGHCSYKGANKSLAKFRRRYENNRAMASNERIEALALRASLGLPLFKGDLPPLLNQTG